MSDIVNGWSSEAEVLRSGMGIRNANKLDQFTEITTFIEAASAPKLNIDFFSLRDTPTHAARLQTSGATLSDFLNARLFVCPSFDLVHGVQRKQNKMDH